MGSDLADLSGDTKGLESVFVAPFSFLRFAVNGDDMADIGVRDMQLSKDALWEDAPAAGQ